MATSKQSSPSPSKDENTRKSSRLMAKPRLNVVQLLSENLHPPKVMPKDRVNLLDLQAKDGQLGDEAAEQLSAADSRYVVQSVTSIRVDTDDDQCEITVYPCRVCDFMGSSPQAASKHEDTAHPDMERCKACYMYLNNYSDLEAHAREVHQLTPTAVRCDKCQFIAPDQQSLMSHVEYEHYTGAKKNECCRELVDGRQCTARFVQIRELRKHLSNVHGVAAALDTIQEEFASWEEFMRWKAQFELETGSLYKIGYGRRHGIRRYMCVRSGRYKPVPDEMRRRRPRQNRTIKLGHNCTATMICKFPDGGGVRVVVHPFHYGHEPGDIRLPGMKPEGAPDDWIRADTRKKRKRKQNDKPALDVVAVDWEVRTDVESLPSPTATADGTSQTGDAGQLPQSSVLCLKLEPELQPEPEPELELELEPEPEPEPRAESAGTTSDHQQPAAEQRRCGDDPPAAAAACAGDDQSAATQPPDSSAESELAAPSCPPPKRKLEPKWKRPRLVSPPSPPPPPPAGRRGPGSRYKKLLRRDKLMRRLRRQLTGQLERLQAAREHQVRSTGMASVDQCLIGTALEDASELDDAPPPLAVLRAEPGDVDTLPDGVFPELELLTAPTDLFTAIDDIFDLKMEVLSLRARLVRRAAVETALRAEALEITARQAATERELRAELERARASQGGAAQQLRQMLESMFSPAQLQALEEPAAAVAWAADDYEQAIALRWLCSQEAFDFVRHALKVPLPSMGATRAVAADGRLPHVSEAFLELVQAKALEGETVGGDGVGDLEMHVVMDAADDVGAAAAAAEPELPRAAAHDHGFSPAADRPAPPVVYRRRRQRARPAPPAAAGPMRSIRLRTADGEKAVSVTVRVAEAEHGVWQKRTGELLGRLQTAANDEHSLIGPGAAAAAGQIQELTIVTSPPDGCGVKDEPF